MFEATVSLKVEAVGKISDCGEVGDISADDGIEPKTIEANAGLCFGRPLSGCGRREAKWIGVEFVSILNLLMSIRVAKKCRIDLIMALLATT